MAISIKSSNGMAISSSLMANGVNVAANTINGSIQRNGVISVNAAEMAAAWQLSCESEIAGGSAYQLAGAGENENGNHRWRKAWQ